MVGESKIVLEADAQRVWSGGQGNAHEDMLVDATRLDMKLCSATVERDAEDFGTQADGGLEVDGNLARSSLRSSDFQRDAVDVFGVVQVELCRTDRDVADGERGPFGGNMRRKGERSRGNLGLQAKKAAQQRAHDHRGGPDLVGRAGGKRLVGIARENLGDMAERAVKREQRVGAQIFVSGDRKSTRLNSSHPSISYAVFCLKKKNKKIVNT